MGPLCPLVTQFWVTSANGLWTFSLSHAPLKKGTCYCSYWVIWGFPESWVPPVIIHFRWGFSLINQTFWGYPQLWKPPYCTHEAPHFNSTSNERVPHLTNKPPVVLWAKWRGVAFLANPLVEAYPADLPRTCWLNSNRDRRKSIWGKMERSSDKNILDTLW